MAPSWVFSLKPSSPQGSDLLTTERQKSRIDIDGLARFLYTKEGLDRQQRILKVLEQEKAFDKGGNYFDGRVQRYETALGRAKRLAQIREKYNWSREDLSAAHELIGEATPYALHYGMFIPTIRDQGTPEQHEVFLQRAENFEIIGCYAQTELGHGSNVRGLETTATWNPTDKNFILNSPHLTASKWWIGTLGRTANHAVVMAQLIISGKNYGPHTFICPIRDLKTHEPLEGVHVGDIGPKLGYNTMDNGFLLLNNVKVPHINMLAKFARVDPETNSYVQPASSALVYSTLTLARVAIVLQSGVSLARGATIATRYCAVRRQFYNKDFPVDVGEAQVLDYTMVQARLLPLIAASFALRFTGKNMQKIYDEARASLPGQGSKDQAQRERELFAELHSTSCGLKALSTTVAAEGLEMCRRACGGHGYSLFSGIGSWYTEYVPSATFDGDNYMLTQQVASYLLKSAEAVLKGEKTANNITIQNLSNFASKRHSRVTFDLSKDSDIIAAFGWRSAHLTYDTLTHRDRDGRKWNSLLLEFWRLSTAHSQYMVVKSFFDELSAASSTLDAETHAVLLKLARLYALQMIGQEAHEFYTSRALQVEQVEKATKETILTLLEEIRPHAVSLVDAWKLPDFLLDSSLGRYDGKVYEDMFNRASQLNPLNKLVIDPNPNSEVIVRRTLSKL